jgi:single-strand DNA-binding protein
MNQTTIAGHLGQDPEVRFTSSGKKVTTLRVAARVRRSANKDDVIWWRVSVWGEEFDKMISFLKKGSPVMVVGDLNKPEIFTDREGKPQISMSMTGYNVMFSPFGGGGSKGESTTETSEPNHSPEAVYYGQGKAAAVPTQSFTEDEIPF